MSVATRNAVHLADPFAAYRRLRAADPVHWNDAAGVWTLTRYEDVRAALRHPHLSSRRPADGLDAEEPGPSSGQIVQTKIAKWLIRIDPPEHTRLRAALTRAIAASMTADRRRRLKEMIDARLATAARGRGMDAVADFAVPLAADAIMDLIGVDASHGQSFLCRGEAVSAFMSDPHAPEAARLADHALAATEAHIAELIGERRQTPRDDVITALAQMQDANADLSESEIAGLCSLLLLAGHEPTAYALAHAIYGVLGDPRFTGKVRATREFRGAADELLRYEPPIQGVMRTATAEVKLGQRVIRPGETVVALLGAANRDPAAYRLPEVLDPTCARRRRHLSFGAGVHRCPGAELARTTIELALSALLLEGPQHELASNAVEWSGNALFRHLTSLPLRIRQGDASWTA